MSFATGGNTPSAGPDLPMGYAEHEVWLKATSGWLHNGEFRRKVERAVDMTLKQTRSRTTVTLVREAVALALVLEELES